MKCLNCLENRLRETIIQLQNSIVCKITKYHNNYSISPLSINILNVGVSKEIRVSTWLIRRNNVMKKLFLKWLE